MHGPGFCINRQRVQSAVAAGIQGPSSDGVKAGGCGGRYIADKGNIQQGACSQRDEEKDTYTNDDRHKNCLSTCMISVLAVKTLPEGTVPFRRKGLAFLSLPKPNNHTSNCAYSLRGLLLP